MVGTRTIGRLVDATAASGAKLILVGDPRQLAEISAGGTFRCPGQPARRHRAQREPAPARAVGAPGPRRAPIRRRGEGLLAYDVHDRIRISATMVAARTDLVERWLEARDSGALMLAVNRRDVDDLNAVARTKLIEAGAARRRGAAHRGAFVRPRRRGGLPAQCPKAGRAQRHPGHRGRARAERPAHRDHRRPSGPPGPLRRSRAPRPRLRHHRAQGPGRHLRPGLRAGHRLAHPRGRVCGHEPGPSGNRAVRDQRGLRRRPRSRSG